MSHRVSRAPAFALSLLLVPAWTAHASAQTTASSKDAPSVKAADKKPDGKTAAPADAATASDASAKKADVDPDKDKDRAIYVSLDLAFSRADIGGFSNATSLDKTGANGVLAGVGVGYRYKGLRLGGRFRDTTTTEFSLWSLMGEVGYGLPFRPVAPALFLHAGYVFDVGVERGAMASSLPKGNVLTPNVDLQGVVVGGELVASYWFTNFLRLGPFLGFDATFLHRAQVGLPQSLFAISDETRQKPLFSESGSGLGYVLSIGLRGTGDIAF